METKKQEVSLVELLKQTKPLRDYLKQKYGDGAIAVVKPDSFEIFKFQKGAGEVPDDTTQSDCLEVNKSKEIK